MRRIALTLAAGCLIWPAAASGQVDPAVGCYRIELEEWWPSLDSTEAPAQTPPSTFRLEREVLRSGLGRGLMAVRPTILSDSASTAYWGRVDADSIRVVWTTGYVGVTLRLSERGDSLFGVAEAFTDMVVRGRRNPVADVRGGRIPCAEMDRIR